MIDVEPMILDELEQLAPREPLERDWRDVLNRAESLARPERGTRRRGRIALAGVAVVIGAALPAVAFSAGVRSLLGLGTGPEPKFSEARVLVSTPLPGGRVARLWLSPSAQGGQCLFVTYDRASSLPKATRMNGGGACTIGHQSLRGTLSWSFSMGSRTTPTVISGRAASRLDPARIELRWHKGSRVLASNSGYFIGVAPELANPPFRQLPYDLVVLDHHGHVAHRGRIPTSFLYRNWKRVQPRLHVYRVAHGCSTKIVWRCRSR